MKLRSFGFHKESIKESVPFIIFGTLVILFTLDSYLDYVTKVLMPSVGIHWLFLLQNIELISLIIVLCSAVFGIVVYAARGDKNLRPIARPGWAIFYLGLASSLFVAVAEGVNFPQPVSGIIALLLIAIVIISYLIKGGKDIKSLSHPRSAILYLLLASLLIVVVAVWEPSMNLKSYTATGILVRFWFNCCAICAGIWIAGQLWKYGMMPTAIANAAFWIVYAWFFVVNAMITGGGYGVMGGVWTS